MHVSFRSDWYIPTKRRQACPLSRYSVVLHCCILMVLVSLSRQQYLRKTCVTAISDHKAAPSISRRRHLARIVVSYFIADVLK